MNRLVRAEWYRFLHAGHFVEWLIIVCAVIISLMWAVEPDILSLNIEQMLPACVEGSMSIQLFVPVLVAVIVGFGYMRKTAYYEVMAGNKISQIILSKVVVDAIVVAVCAFAAFCVIPTMAYIRNGLGDVNHVGERVALFFVILLHICIAGALMATALRHIIASVAIYLRFAALEGILSMILLLIASEETPKWLEIVQEWLVVNQITQVFLGEVTARFTVAVLGSLLLEAAFLYVISYICMKKKLYR